MCRKTSNVAVLVLSHLSIHGWFKHVHKYKQVWHEADGQWISPSFEDEGFKSWSPLLTGGLGQAIVLLSHLQFSSLES